jgi:hypothetical protein
MRGVDWIDVIQTDNLRAVVRTVMKFRVSNIQGISWLTEDLLASQDGLCSMELVGWLVDWLVGS